MIETMTTVVGEAYDTGADAFELLDKAESEIFRISESQLRRAGISMKEVVKQTLENLEKVHGNEGGITGVPTGFTRLDQMTGGWQRTDLIIVAARPSMGKTAFALALATKRGHTSAGGCGRRDLLARNGRSAARAASADVGSSHRCPGRTYRPNERPRLGQPRSRSRHPV
jgi:hypothetical protein